MFSSVIAHVDLSENAHGTGALIWVPLLQLFPLLRAAGMSRVWFVAFLVPLVNVVAQIVWYVKIVEARGKACGRRFSCWCRLPVRLRSLSRFLQRRAVQHRATDTAGVAVNGLTRKFGFAPQSPFSINIRPGVRFGFKRPKSD